MPTTWTIAIDWDRNGNYTDTYDDVTSRVTQVNWFLGMRKPYQETADNSALALVLTNTDRRFSPEYASSPLFGKVVPFKPIRIQSNDGSTIRTHWVGWIEAIQPAVNKYGERLTKIVASGVMQFYKATETNIALQENKRTDEVIAELIKDVVVPPAMNSAWVLGRVGNSEIGEKTIIADTTSYSTLDQGKIVLGMAADNWVRDGGLSNVNKNSFDVYQAVQDITAAEHGKFLFDREGKAVFWNRHHLLDVGSAAATFDDVMTEAVYTYANVDQCKNEVIAICHPRTISATATDILWQLGESVIQVEVGKTKTFYIKYEDEGKKRVGAKEVVVTDVEFAQGSAVVTVDAKANGAEIKAVNNGTVAAVIKKCVLKGRKILDSGDMEAKSIDQNSIVDYGRRTLRINLPSIDNLDRAQDIADFERDRRSTPRGEVTSLTMLSHGKNGGGQHVHQLARTLGDLVAVKETQTAHDKQYFVIGEAHELTMGATLWKTTWYLEPAPSSTPWKLGDANFSKIGETTTLTY